MSKRDKDADDNQYKVLICDDSIANVMLLSELLEDRHIAYSKWLTDPKKVAEEIVKDDYDLLLLDIEMPHMSGFDVMQQLQDEKLVDEYFPILILTGHQDSETRNRALEAGAADFINKPFDQTEVVLRVQRLLEVRSAYKAKAELAEKMEAMVEERTRELSMATDILIQRLAKAGELRDNDTGRHVLRVGRFARIIAEGVGLPSKVAFMIEKAAPLHDLGKIGIPDSILLKQGELDEEERKIMDTHAEIGADLLEEHESALVRMASSIALTHHEKWDGTGYPRGLSGESIPTEGRITAISDVYDALTTVRPYKDAWSVEDAVKAIKQGAGTHFDPELVEAFVNNFDKVREVQETLRD